ncbi:MAG TPA: hypothetical protein VM100_11095 [Longimicrobiales bacterium]|nr:hypothetical protein [Longimicrobiales bacterium]
MRVRFLLLILAAVASGACDDALGPQAWDATPDTITLYSASRTDLLGFPSGYDFVNRTPIRVEAAGTVGAWDVVLAGTTTLQLVPAGAFQGNPSRAGIAVITGATFDALKEAPSDTAAFTQQPVTIANGGVYVVRTRRYACSFSTAVNFAKVKVVALDVAAGSARFAVVRNPYCNDRSFVPPEN